jgi:hypothetical protein
MPATHLIFSTLEIPCVLSVVALTVGCGLIIKHEPRRYKPASFDHSHLSRQTNTTQTRASILSAVRGYLMWEVTDPLHGLLSIARP